MFLTRSIGAIDRGPADDFWYQPVGMVTSAGMRVSPEQAMRLTVVYACVKVLAESVAQLPLHIYRRRDDGGKDRAVNHPLYRILHRRPNRWQTSFEWREMMMGHLALRGNAYSEIVVSPNGRIRELIPLHPDRVSIDVLDPDTGSYRYRVRNDQGQERTIPAGSMFHLRGLSSDGLIGLNPIEQEREAIGLTLAAQDYGARFYQNGATPPGWIEFPGHFKDDEARRKFRESWQEAQVGANRHKIAVLERGMKYHELGIKHTDAQFLETRKYQDVDIARIFRVPPHKVGILDKATFSNIEQQSIEFVTDTLMPWLIRWEQAILRDLITREDEYFAEFSVEGLLRGDAKARGEFYASGITNGWLTRNEVRIKENLNPLDGLDEPLQPLNMATVGQAQDPAQPDQAARAERLALVNAQRVVKREVESVRRAYRKALEMHDPTGFEAWVREFFGERGVEYVARVMAVPRETARAYIEASREALLAAYREECETSTQCILALLDDWEIDKANDLAAIGDET